MSEQWLKCSVSRGMFSDERAVEINSRNGRLSVFVHQRFVHETGSIGKLRVGVFESEGIRWAVLPTETRPSIPVEDSEFAAA